MDPPSPGLALNGCWYSSDHATVEEEAEEEEAEEAVVEPTSVEEEGETLRTAPRDGGKRRPGTDVRWFFLRGEQKWFGSLNEKKK